MTRIVLIGMDMPNFLSEFELFSSNKLESKLEVLVPTFFLQVEPGTFEHHLFSYELELKLLGSNDVA